MAEAGVERQAADELMRCAFDIVTSERREQLKKWGDQKHTDSG